MLNPTYINLFILDNYENSDSLTSQQTLSIKKHCFKKIIFSIIILVQLLIKINTKIMIHVQFLPLQIVLILIMILSYKIYQKNKISNETVELFGQTQILTTITLFLSIIAMQIVELFHQVKISQLQLLFSFMIIIISSLISSWRVRISLFVLLEFTIMITLGCTLDEGLPQSGMIVFQSTIDCIQSIAEADEIATFISRTKQSYWAFHDMRNKMSSLEYSIGEIAEETQNISQLINNNSIYANNTLNNTLNKDNSHTFNKEDMGLLEDNIKSCKNVVNCIIFHLTRSYTQELLFTQTQTHNLHNFEILDFQNSINNLSQQVVMDKTLQIESILKPSCLNNIEIDQKLFLQVYTHLILQLYDQGSNKIQVNWENTKYTQGSGMLNVRFIHNLNKKIGEENSKMGKLVITKIIEFLKKNDINNKIQQFDQEISYSVLFYSKSQDNFEREIRQLITSNSRNDNYNLNLNNNQNNENYDSKVYDVAFKKDSEFSDLKKNSEISSQFKFFRSGSQNSKNESNLNSKIEELIESEIKLENDKFDLTKTSINKQQRFANRLKEINDLYKKEKENRNELNQTSIQEDILEFEQKSINPVINKNDIYNGNILSNIKNEEIKEIDEIEISQEQIKDNNQFQTPSRINIKELNQGNNSNKISNETTKEFAYVSQEKMYESNDQIDEKDIVLDGILNQSFDHEESKYNFNYLNPRQNKRNSNFNKYLDRTQELNNSKLNTSREMYLKDRSKSLAEIEIIKPRVQINLDDEGGILKMNHRLFAKMNVDLRLCKTGDDLIILLQEINERHSSTHKIIVISDYMLEKEQGDQVIIRAMEFNTNLQDSNLNLQLADSLDIQQIGLSSSEDKQVKDKFNQINVKLYQKPLTKKIVEEIIGK